MKKSKAISIITILSVLVLLVVSSSWVTASYLSKKAKILDRWDCLPGASIDVGCYCRCIRVNPAEESQAIANIKNALADDETFLGIYRYPDVDLVDGIWKNGELVEDGSHFQTFEYNEDVEKFYHVSLIEGSMFEFRDYSLDEALPVVVTEDFGLSVGDEVQVVFDTRPHEYGEEPTVSCKGVVCGVAKADRFMPFNNQTVHYEYRPEAASIVYTPNLDAYRAQFDYVYPYSKTGWIPYYLMFSTNPHGDSIYATSEENKLRDTLNKFAYLDVNAEGDQVFFSNLFPAVLELNRLSTPDFLSGKLDLENTRAYPTLIVFVIALSSLCVAALLALMVTVIVKWRRSA